MIENNDDIFYQRARIFGPKGLNWVPVLDSGMEKDRLDNLPTVRYIRYGNPLIGSMRIVPTTGPTLLTESFSYIIPTEGILISPTIWEASRMCVENSQGIDVVQKLANQIFNMSDVDAAYFVSYPRIFTKRGWNVKILNEVNNLQLGIIYKR
jgi:N-acyl-L-homoserine lactone synthetase